MGRCPPSSVELAIGYWVLGIGYWVLGTRWVVPIPHTLSAGCPHRYQSFTYRRYIIEWGTTRRRSGSGIIQLSARAMQLEEWFVRGRWPLKWATLTCQGLPKMWRRSRRTKGGRRGGERRKRRRTSTSGREGRRRLRSTQCCNCWRDDFGTCRKEITDFYCSTNDIN